MSTGKAIGAALGAFALGALVTGLLQRKYLKSAERCVCLVYAILTLVRYAVRWAFAPFSSPLTAEYVLPIAYIRYMSCNCVLRGPFHCVFHARNVVVDCHFPIRLPARSRCPDSLIFCVIVPVIFFRFALCSAAAEAAKAKPPTPAPLPSPIYSLQGAGTVVMC